MKSQYIGKVCMVRSARAGVFFGTLDEKDGMECRITSARRVWYWAGAASLSELATRGTSAPRQCKFPAPVDTVELSEVIEVIPMTEQAVESLEQVPVWSA